MAVSITNPVEALMFFFVAVVLVIIGHILPVYRRQHRGFEILKRNKNYYYKPEHFISVSGMMYRMKQNAVGLANICILSTMVLVMLSATSTMFIGTENSLMERYPRDIAVQLSGDWDEAAANAAIEKCLADNSLTAENRLEYTKEEFAALLRGDELIFDTSVDLGSGELISLRCITLEDFNSITGRNDTLEADQVYMFPYDGESIELLGMRFETLDPGDVSLDAIASGSYYGLYGESIDFVVPDMETLQEIRCASAGGIRHRVFGARPSDCL